jgi:D-serine deaminase-like pyridoxal phosphate-dependent protein
MGASDAMRLSELTTPALVVDRQVVARNCEAMAARLAGHGVALRPHLKTAKSVPVAALATAGQAGGLTVSTLAEAAHFADHGYRDLTYAVGIVPDKLDRVAALQRAGARLTLLTDDIGAVAALSARAVALDSDFRLLIEIDCGGRRGGLEPNDAALPALGQAITAAPGLELAGVLTHAGQSYHCRSLSEIEAVAEAERAAVVDAAERLRAAGLACPVVSAGSTPTAVHARQLDGVTEMRPGVYVFFDLDQVGIGACRLDDIALGVVASVIGHNRRAGRILIDAGGLALSKDVSAGEFFDDVGYGLVCPLGARRPIAGLYVAEVHQEHGLIAAAAGQPDYEAFPVGRKLRILPNHACMTAAAYEGYHVVAGGEEIVDRWPRVNGW